MDSIFSDVPNVCVYFDNLYIIGKDDTEHLQTLQRVLKVIGDKGLKVNKDKCQFMLEEINFLGYKLNKQGIRLQDKKTKAIKDAPSPENPQQLKAFLGMINYYSKFMGNLSSILSPLYKLLQKDVPWQWDRDQESAFSAAKRALSSDTLLVHFDPGKKHVLTCDASPDGVGAVLSQIDECGERPVAFASRSLNRAKRNYSQRDRERLGIIFGVKKFHKFIFGKKATIITDHKPLLGLFGEHKAIPEHCSPRVQRWAITLAAYDYELKHKAGVENSADGLSRLPLHTEISSYIPEDIEMIFNVMENSFVNVNDVKRETLTDECLMKVYEFCLNGWPDECVQEELRPFKNKKLKLSLEDGCILWGTRVVIPKTLQNKVLSMLHDTHIGASKMKSLARSWYWWPNMDADIEKFVKLCSTCAQHAKQPAKSPLQNWDWPLEPWKRIHIDFAGPFLNKMFLIVIDAHSTWIDVKTMTTITASDTIIELKEIFSTHGLPDQIVSDNGPTFTSLEFKTFCSANGIEHITTSPYHPAGNGLAERAVGIFKTAMIKLGSICSLRERVNRFLARYRSTPHVTTGVAPCELLCGRKIKTHLDLVHPTVQSSVSQHQCKQKLNYDRTSSEREFGIYDSVYVRNYGKGERWIPGQIVESTGPVSYKVRANDGLLMRRHADQIRVTCAQEYESDTPLSSGTSDIPLPDSKSVVVDLGKPESPASIRPQPLTNQCESQPNQGSGSPNPRPLRRSNRITKAPDRLVL